MFEGGRKSRVCPLCDIAYPTDVMRCKVADCLQPTVFSAFRGVDVDWDEKVMEKNAPPSPYPHPPDARLNLIEGPEGTLWIQHGALLNLGYTALTEDSVIFVNDTFYELVGFRDSDKTWWIKEVEIDAESLEPWMFVDAQEA